MVFNLKCYLAKALVGDIKEKMGKKFGVERIKKSIYDTSFDRNSYLYCMLFHDQGLQKDFVDSFSAEIEDYPNPPSDYLEEKGNLVYIKKGIFDDVEFIKDIIAYNASLECRYLQTPSAKNKTVDKLKYTIIDFIDRAAGIPVRTITRTSYVDKKEDSVLIPLVQHNNFLELFTEGDADDLNRVFGDAVVTRIESRCLKNPYWSSNYVYAIDFADVDISYCVLNKIIESSVINKDHELSIDPELVRALSPAQSPFNSPTHAEPPRTPPKQRQEDRDSGYGSNSPPKPKDSVAHSPSGVPRSLFEQPQAQRSPAQSRDEELEGYSRQGYMEAPVLQVNLLDIPGTSEEFPPRSHLSYTAVSRVVSGPSSSLQSVGAAQNVPAGTSAWDQQPNRWSLPAPSAGLWSLPQSRPSSWKGANPVGANPRAQPMSPGSSQSSNVMTPPIYYGIPKRPTLPTTENDPKSSSPEFSARSPGVEDVKSICGVEPEKQQVSDECSEAKSQKSESPKEHGGGFKSKIKHLLTLPSKPKQHDASFKRCDVGRDTTRSIPAISVTEKLPVSKPSFSFPSRIRAKNNSPSKETSPVHSTINGSIPGLSSQGTTVVESNSGLKSQKRLDPDQREELLPFLSPKMKEKLGSNSFSPGEEQHLYLTHTLSGKWEIKKFFENQEENLRRSVKAQLPSSDNLSSKKVNGDGDSGFCSTESASPAVPHKESVLSKVKGCSTQQVKHMSEAFGK